LGYIKLNTEKPFMAYNRDEPIIGNASLSIGHSGVKWNCFYRPGFERWRVPKHYWSTFFYCPAPTSSSCELLEASKGRLSGVLTMELESRTWKAKFAVNNVARQTKNLKYQLASIKQDKPSMAVCLIIPYTSSDPVKETVNGAIMFEWVQYYALLGFKVLVYDKDGANHRFLMEGKYGEAQGKEQNKWRENVVYHPNTVLGMVDRRQNLSYDNLEKEADGANRDVVRRGGMSYRQIVSYTDDDKTATLTHCRFEASALYGIENVLVSDFDEFLYCPGAASTFSAQRHWLDKLLQRYKDENIDQMVFLQVWTAANLHRGYYETPLSCLQDKVSKGNSIFECFAGVDYTVKTTHFGKSMHIGHKCPLTDFHSSCHSSDCNCSVSYAGLHEKYVNIPDDDRCFFIHLSSNQKDYAGVRFSNKTRALLESSQSEIYSMLHRQPIK
jgi:hypothetical protein